MTVQSSPYVGPRSLAVPWTLWDIAKALALVVVGTIAFNLLAIVAAHAILQPGQDYEDSAASYTILLISSLVIQELVLLGAAVWFGPRTHGVSLETIWLRRTDRGSWWFPLAVASAALVIAHLYAPLLSLAGIEIEAATQPKVSSEAGPLLVTVLGAVLMAPIMEEVFFRGFLFGGLSSRWGWIAAAVVSSLIFGLAHLSVDYLPAYAAIGFLFAWSYWRTASLVPGITAHAITNAVSTAIGFATSVW